MKLSTKMGLVLAAATVVVVGTPLLRSWDDEGRVTVSAYLEYSPVDRSVAASWKLGFDVHNETIHHSPFGTAGAARTGDVIFFVGVPVGGVSEMTVTLSVRGKAVRICGRVEVENSTCTWVVA